MAFKKWTEMPYSVRMSKRKLYEYLVSELTEDSTTTTPTSDNTDEGDSEGDG